MKSDAARAGAGAWALECRGLSKRYYVAARRQSYQRLSETIMAWLPGLFDRRARQETFWALRDVTFTVERGEILGVIGRNGAGKSTLLKLLSGITKPTEGLARVRGRIGSMLEV